MILNDVYEYDIHVLKMIDLSIDMSIDMSIHLSIYLSILSIQWNLET